MAINSTYDAFNPEEKNVAPGSYIGLFRPIDSYENQSGLGIAMKGAANLLDKGLEAANALILNEGRNQVEKGIEPIVEDYTKSLEDARDYVRSATKPTATGTYSTDLVPGPEGGVPAGTPVGQSDDFPGDRGVTIASNDAESLTARAEIKPEIAKLEKTLDLLKTSNAQGKIDDTYFRGRVADKAKDIRNNFPIGYRPEIDAMISAKMHTVQANPYIESLQRDINSYLTGKNQEKNSTLSWLRTHADVEGVPAIFNDLATDKIDYNEAVRRASIPLRENKKVAETLQRLEMQGKILDTNTKLAEQEFQGIANSVLTKKLSTVVSAAGVDGKLQDILIQAQRGDITLTSQEALVLQRKAEALRLETLEEVRKLGTTIKGGRSYSSLTSMANINKVAEDTAQHFAIIRDGFSKGDSSVFASRAQDIDAARQDFKYDAVYSYPEMAHLLNITDLLKKYNVPDAQIQDMIRPLMMAGAPGMTKFDQFTKMAKASLATPQEVEASLNEKLKIPNFKSGLENMRQIQDKYGIKLTDQVSTLVDIIDGKYGVSLVNTKDPQIQNAIAAKVFGPGNENAFRYFNENMYDEKGRLIPGAQALFNRFSKPDVVKVIMGLPQQRQAEYNDFMTITAREDLLRNDLPKLKELMYSPNAPWQLAWDTETKNFKVIPSPSMNQTNIKPEMKAQLDQKIYNVNQVLDGLKSIAVTTGRKDKDIDAYVLAPIMQSLGDFSNTPGLDLGIATVIRNAYLEQAKREEAAKVNKELYTKPAGKETPRKVDQTKGNNPEILD